MIMSFYIHLVIFDMGKGDNLGDTKIDEWQALLMIKTKNNVL